VQVFTLLPQRGRLALIDWRARRIKDPVKKLRYLRARLGEPVARRGWRTVLMALGALLALAPGSTMVRTVSATRAVEGPRAVAAPADRVADVWLVEEKAGSEVYSNGLRIDTRLAIAGERRRYPVFSRYGPAEIAGWREAPVGIVYHTTENHLAPFERDYNARLRRAGRWLLDYVQSRQAYHYVVDRFGRVFRVVEESDAANHAGLSVWADARWLYVNLNRSFLGVAFEAQTATGGTDPPEAGRLTPPQVLSGRLLTAMLRARYGIAASNCVTHAQVSVAPAIRRVGNHLDWASGFPFEDMGLPDNYGVALPAVANFGFGYDAGFLKVAGARFWKGLALGVEQLRQDAAAAGLAPGPYRTLIEERYRKMLALQPTAVGPAETIEEPDR
jgi:hypothetical protein